MIRNDSELSIRKQCELLGFNRSSMYYDAKSPDEELIAYYEQLMQEIDRIHGDMPYAGSRKIRVKLNELGYKVGRKLVQSLMRQMCIYTIYPKENLSRNKYKEGIVPYLCRNINITKPNQVWSVDITYIAMGKNHMYLSAIIDWYSRKLVGWDLSDSLDSISVITAVRKACEIYGCPEILNSDQGSQFTSAEYKALLKELGIKQSMDGKSRWADNIMIERWFRSLKTENLYINEYSTPRSLRRGIAEYIEQYNTERPHEALGYRTPDDVYFSIKAAA